MGKFFNDALRRERLRQDLRLSDIANAIGVEKEYISKLEEGTKTISSLGKRTLSKDQIEKMAELLCVSPEKLYRDDLRSTKVIVISNNKGGSHKTTTSVNLAYGLSLLKKKVLLIDADEQANATYSYGVPVVYDKATLMAMFEDMEKDEFAGLRNYITETEYNVDIIKGNPDNKLLNTYFVTGILKKNSIKRALEIVKGSGLYDYIVIDTNPALDPAKELILEVSDGVIVPTVLRAFSVNSMDTTLRFIEDCRNNNGNVSAKVMGILVSGVDNSRKKSNLENLEYLSEFEERYDIMIPTDVQIEYSQQFEVMKPVLAHDNKSKAGLAFLELAKEVIKNG